MANQNQNPMDAFKAQGLPEFPVGSPDELKEKGLPTNVFRSCEAPSNDGGQSVRGCQLWHQCTMSYKGLPSKDGGGPRAHCWERVKAPENGGGIVRSCAPCYWGVSRQNTAFENNEVLHTIADEGESYEHLTIVPVPEGGRDNLGYFKWEEQLLKLRVPEFERLGKQQAMAKHQLRAEVMKREQERVVNERRAKHFGAPVGSATSGGAGEGSSEGLRKSGEGKSRS